MRCKESKSIPFWRGSSPCHGVLKTDHPFHVGCAVDAACCNLTLTWPIHEQGTLSLFPLQPWSPFNLPFPLACLPQTHPSSVCALPRQGYESWEQMPEKRAPSEWVSGQKRTAKTAWRLLLSVLPKHVVSVQYICKSANLFPSKFGCLVRFCGGNIYWKFVGHCKHNLIYFIENEHFSLHDLLWTSYC